MASAGETSAHGDGFTMEFTLDIVSNIAQDVEEVARQGALGNFRKAHTMYEEALKTHRNKFPVYAEYLRLCLDGGDWASLAKDLADSSENADLRETHGWNNLESNIVELLRAESKCFSAGSERSSECLVSSRRLSRQLEATSFLKFDDEQTFAAVILLQLGYLGPECFSLSTQDLRMLFASQVEQHNYWAAESVLEVYFYTFRELNNEESVRRHLGYVWILISGFLAASQLREEEQYLWARIAILQTFCEGALSVCSAKDQLHGEDSWSFPKIMPVLRLLVDQALSRDDLGDWACSRGVIRQELIDLDQEVMADHAYMNNDLCFKRYETLLRLWKIADTNNDRIMVSSIQGKFWLLSHMQEPQTRGLGMSFVPYQVDARCAYPTPETTAPSHGNIDHGPLLFAAAPNVPPDSALSSRYPSQYQQAREDIERYSRSDRWTSGRVSKNDAYEDSTERASHPDESTQKKKSKQSIGSRVLASQRRDMPHIGTMR